MIKPKNETEDLLPPITKNWETAINRTHTEIEETFQFKLINSRETFDFQTPIPIDR